MLFALTCKDRPDSLALRQQTRPAHLDYLDKHVARIAIAGPLMENGQPAGSLLIIEAADEREAGEFAAQDPYALAGLFAHVDIRPFRTIYRDGKRAG